MGKRYDPMALIGKPYGMLTVREYVGRDPDTKLAMFRCTCSCKPGAEKVVSRKNLVTGSIKSCGCLKHARRSTEDQTRYYAPEMKKARAMRDQPQVPYKIVYHR